MNSVQKDRSAVKFAFGTLVIVVVVAVFFLPLSSPNADLLGSRDLKIAKSAMKAVEQKKSNSIRRAIAVSKARFMADRPAIVIGTGGMASVPAVLAARRLGIATAILNPDAIPGRANKYLAGRVDAS